MKVRMKVAVSGTRNGQAWPRRGEVIDVPDHEGAQLCAGGLAEPVAARQSIETATPPEPEKRTEPEKPRKRGRPALPRDASGNVIRG